MRVSANLDDEGYTNDTENYEILLDGKNVEYVITADEEKGYVVSYIKAEDGMIKRCKNSMMTGKQYGVVEIIKRDAVKK